MLSLLVSVLTLSALLGAALIAGVCFAFGSFILRALTRLPALQGVGAMQSINEAVLNRSFLGVFVGTAAACLALTVDAALRWSAPGAELRLAGSLAYLGPVLVVTRACNIPLNEMLAKLPAQGSTAQRGWARYLSAWRAWNTVRWVGALLATALLSLGLGGVR